MNKNDIYEKITIPKTLLLYCFKADNYTEYNRRVYILSKYIKKQYDKRVEKAIIYSIYDFIERGGLF